MNTAVLQSANEQDESAALQRLLDEVQTIATQFTSFLEGVTLLLLELVIPSLESTQGSVEVIDPQLSFVDIAIPHFYNHDLPDV